MVHSWLPEQRYASAYNAVSWSISTECFFYLCFPILIWRWERTWWFKLPLVFSMTCGIIWYCNSTHLTVESYDINGACTMVMLVYFHPLSRLFEFTLGMTVALAWKKIEPRVRINLVWGTVVEVIALAFMGLTLYRTVGWATKAVTIPGIGLAGGYWLKVAGGSVLSCSFLIFVMALHRGFISRLLAQPFPVLLGEISFTIYLVHMILIHYMRKHSALPNMSPTFAYATYWLWVVTLSYLIWRFMEKPCRSVLLRLWPQPEPLLKEEPLIAVPIRNAA